MLINPGTGPTLGIAAIARRNMGVFCRELALPFPRILLQRDRSGDRNGSFGFRLDRGSCSVRVRMPGLPLDEVRFGQGANPFRFPRLYIDGSSWLWECTGRGAINRAREALAP